VIWGREWDELLAKDHDGALVNLMNVHRMTGTTRPTRRGRRLRPRALLRPRPATRAMVEHMSDKEIWGLSRGGHDYRKMYAAYDAATKHSGQPT
jgi:pyruvate dehydrogenase E1 component